MNNSDARNRVEKLAKLSQSLSENQKLLSDILAEEVGATKTHLDNELGLTTKALRTFEMELPYLDKRNPVGRIAIVIPYNAIGILLAMSLGTAYLAGNIVELKFSSKTQKSEKLLADIITKELGDQVTFRQESGRDFINNHLQSENTGVMQIYGHDSWMIDYKEAVKKSGKKLIFEGPGKDPCIILQDVNLDYCKDILRACYSNSGQLCMSLERFYVHTSIQDRFLEKIVDITKSLTIGDSRDSKTDIGPIVSEKTVNTIEEQLSDAKVKGAKIIYGGQIRQGRINGKAVYFVEPAILTGINENMKIMQEETFGPIVPIQSFDDYDEALYLANNCKYALGSCVFGEKGTEYISHQLRKTHSFCLVNKIFLTNFDAHAPWGGYKRSGWIWETVNGSFIERNGPKRLIIEFSTNS